MGPSNLALVKLYRADLALREAQGRLDDAARSVRVQERRIKELTEKLNLAQAQLREQQAKSAQFDLEIKSRDARIERYRTQQQDAKNHKEYQAFLSEINTEKIDKGKVEEQMLKVMEEVEKLQAHVKDLSGQIDVDQLRYEETCTQLAGKLNQLQAEVDSLRPARDDAAKAVPPRILDEFERLAERFEGEALAAISRPNRRHEEYNCTACNMTLVADVYNRLHSRDELVYCPSCRRMLFIPDDLSPDQAINKPKERRDRPGKTVPAAMTRQTSAIDVARSINQEEEEDAPPSDMPADPTAHPAQ